MKKIICLLLAVLMVFSLCACSKGKTYKAVITVENYGEIKLELDGKAAPITVENFVNLAKSGFYDGLTFHRVVDNFMIQGGDPKFDCTGGSDKTIKGEFFLNGYKNPISHVRGVISMSRNGFSNDSASSQFFICQTDCRETLDGRYAAFGRVTEGMEIVDQICKDCTTGNKAGVLPKEDQPVITTIKILD